MNAFDRRDLEVALRYNLPSFIQRSFQTVVPAAEYLDNWHIDAMAWHLQQCLDGRIKRLIITVPPRNLKSICASVAFPAWVLGRDPTRRIICASYANDLTAKHARDCRAVMESPWYRSLFPRTRLNPKKSAELEFETTRQGYRYGTSTGGALTGRGGNFLIIDDPIKPADAMSVLRREFVKQWFDITVYSRLDSKKDDVIIILMQRVHVDDLVGHILEKDAGWVHLDLPAIADAPQAVPIVARSARYCIRNANRWRSSIRSRPRWAARPFRRSTSSARCRSKATWSNGRGSGSTPIRRRMITTAG